MSRKAAVAPFSSHTELPHLWPILKPAPCPPRLTCLLGANLTSHSFTHMSLNFSLILQCVQLRLSKLHPATSHSYSSPSGFGDWTSSSLLPTFLHGQLFIALTLLCVSYLQERSERESILILCMYRLISPTGRGQAPVACFFCLPCPSVLTGQGVWPTPTMEWALGPCAAGWNLLLQLSLAWNARGWQ